MAGGAAERPRLVEFIPFALLLCSTRPSDFRTAVKYSTAMPGESPVAVCCAAATTAVHPPPWMPLALPTRRQRALLGGSCTTVPALSADQPGLGRAPPALAARVSAPALVAPYHCKSSAASSQPARGRCSRPAAWQHPFGPRCIRRRPTAAGAALIERTGSLLCNQPRRAVVQGSPTPVASSRPLQFAHSQRPGSSTTV